MSYGTATPFIVSDRVSHTLTAFAREIACSRRTELVDVPTVRADGSPGRVRLLLGATTQLSAEPMADDADVPTEAAFLDDLNRQLALIRQPPAPLTEPDDGSGPLSSLYD